MALAVQAALGNVGEKPVTFLTDYDFNSICSINNQPIAVNSSGIYRLNKGSEDVEQNFVSSFTLATSDFGIQNIKRIRFIYLGLITSSDLDVYIQNERSEPVQYTVKHLRDGFQRIRFPVSRNEQSRYFTIQIKSSGWFTINNIDALLITRSSGITGY